MKHPFTSHILPYFSIGAGGLGLCLRLWLFSATDEKGLLPANHPAQYALFLLAGIVVAIVFLATRELQPVRLPGKTVRLANLAGHIAGGLGLILAGLTDFSMGVVSLSKIAMFLCLVGGLAMFFAAFLIGCKKKPPYWLYVFLTAVLMVDAVAQCQVWGAIPQLQEYFFPLLATVFLILTAYHRTALAVRMGKPRHLAFFSQCALFFCCLSLNTDQWCLYLGLLLWAGAQLYPSLISEKEA
jgi:hypothetical protein